MNACVNEGKAGGCFAPPNREEVDDILGVGHDARLARRCGVRREARVHERQPERAQPLQVEDQGSEHEDVGVMRGDEGPHAADLCGKCGKGRREGPVRQVRQGKA